MDNQILENYAPVWRREQVDDVLGTCDTIRQGAENEGQQNEKRREELGQPSLGTHSCIDASLRCCSQNNLGSFGQ